MIRKIPIDELVPGMKVVRMASDLWTYMPYLYTEEGVIESYEQIAEIKKKGYQTAFIEDVFPPDGLTDEERLEKLLSQRLEESGTRSRRPFEEVISKAKEAYSAAITQTQKIVNDIKLGKRVDYQAASQSVQGIIKATSSNPDTIICLSKLEQHDSYTYSHSINVAAIAVVFGEFIGMNRDELQQLGTAGLLHDIGKLGIPDRIINKRGRLTEKEFSEIKKHPSYATRILARYNDIPPSVIRAVGEHHEKYNGSGYPVGLKREGIGVFGRILSLADVYDALTSNRSYKSAIMPNQALAIMYGMRDQDFQSREVQLFIKCLGIYPAGSLVKLSDGSFAVVFQSNRNSPLLPKIKIILDHNGKPVPPQIIDLSVPTQAQGLDIVECAEPGRHKINLREYLLPTSKSHKSSEVSGQ